MTERRSDSPASGGEAQWPAWRFYEVVNLETTGSHAYVDEKPGALYDDTGPYQAAREGGFC